MTDQNIIKNKEVISDRSELKLYLEQRKNKVILGDFDALYQLLLSLLSEITPAILDTYLTQEPANTTTLIQQYDPDGAHQDLARIALCLVPDHTEDIVEIVESMQSQSKKPSPLLNFVYRSITLKPGS